MNNAHKDHFQSWPWKIQQVEVDRTVSNLKDEMANYPDPTDQRVKECLISKTRERKLIRKIESTMDLIDQDEYGYCESCGIEIGIKRLATSY